MDATHIATRFIRLPPPRQRRSNWQRVMRSVLGLLAVVPFALAAHLAGVPGQGVRWRILLLALRAIAHGGVRANVAQIYNMLCFPMESTRYFEFEFVWRRLRDLKPQSYLDVSSPRFLPLLLVNSIAPAAVVLLNPDADDLATTISLAEGTGLAAGIRFESRILGDAGIPPDAFDLITSVSVIEHIRDDRTAVEQLWRALRPGGRLLLSMPCARVAEEQFINIRRYEFAPQEDDGREFHQHVYDEPALERLFEITGRPVFQQIYGETEPGLHQRIYERKWVDANYPFWKEPWFMRSFARFDAMGTLPGEGVVLLEFVKP